MDWVIPKRGRWRPTEQFARQKLIGTSKRISPSLMQALIAASAPIPVGCLLGRLKYQGRQLCVNRKDSFFGLPCLIVTGSDDADHPRETDQTTVDWLRELGVRPNARRRSFGRHFRTRSSHI